MAANTTDQLYLRDFVVKDSQGSDISMHQLLKPVTLIINCDCAVGPDTNTECAMWQSVYARHRDKGFEIVAFPSDQFHLLGKTDCDAAMVQTDLAKRYGVTFPIMHKVLVNGQKAHPLFMYLQTKLSGFPTDAIKWDFTKFLIVNGEPKTRYAPTTSPQSIEEDIVDELVRVGSSHPPSSSLSSKPQPQSSEKHSLSDDLLKLNIQEDNSNNDNNNKNFGDDSSSLNKSGDVGVGGDVVGLGGDEYHHMPFQRHDSESPSMTPLRSPDDWWDYQPQQQPQQHKDQKDLQKQSPDASANVSSLGVEGVWSSAPQTEFLNKNKQRQQQQQQQQEQEQPQQVPAQDSYFEGVNTSTTTPPYEEIGGGVGNVKDDDKQQQQQQQHRHVFRDAAADATNPWGSTHSSTLPTREKEGGGEDKDLVDKETLEVPPVPEDEFVELKQTKGMARRKSQDEKEQLRAVVQGIWSEDNSNQNLVSSNNNNDGVNTSSKESTAEKEAWLNRQSTESGPFGTTPQLHLFQQQQQPQQQQTMQSGAGTQAEQADWLAFRSQIEEKSKQGQQQQPKPDNNINTTNDVYDTVMTNVDVDESEDTTELGGPDPAIREHVGGGVGVGGEGYHHDIPSAERTTTTTTTGQQATTTPRIYYDSEEQDVAMRDRENTVYSGSALDATTSWTPTTTKTTRSGSDRQEPYTLSREDIGAHTAEKEKPHIESDMAFAHTTSPILPTFEEDPWAQLQPQEPNINQQPQQQQPQQQRDSFSNLYDEDEMDRLPKMQDSHWPVSEESAKKQGDVVMDAINKDDAISHQHQQQRRDIIEDVNIDEGEDLSMWEKEREGEVSHGALPRSQATVSDVAYALDMGMIRQDPGDHGLEDEKA